MSRKGMSTSIVIIVSAVVILITALVVLGVFTGGLGTFQSIFTPWANQTGNAAQCQTQCATLCSFAAPNTHTPSTYDTTKCAAYPCDCQNLK
jgi:hypothetical protein